MTGPRSADVTWTRALVFCALALPFARAQNVTFSDVSALLQPFSHQGATFGGDGLAGAAWFDYDRDGDVDLFIANGKQHANALFQNDGTGGFTEVAAAAGVQGGTGHCSVSAVDLDNDGWQDLFLTGDGGWLGTGESPVRVYRNLGSGTFADITATAGITITDSALMATFGDIDGDGDLDVFIAAPGHLFMPCPGALTPGCQHPSKLFKNEFAETGAIAFTDIGASAGVDTSIGSCVGFFHDFDDDGDVDLFVGNCDDVGLAPTPIELFRNNGDLTFTDVAADVGLTNLGYWMGFAPADLENDGDLDIFMTNIGTGIMAPHALFRKDAGATYTDVAPALGVANHGFGWGCTLDDLDNDGWGDLFFVGALPGGGFIGLNGGNPGLLFFNDGAGALAPAAAGALPVNLINRYTSGVARGDFDGDGFQDLVIVTDDFLGDGGHPVLLRNDGNGNGAVRIELEGTASNRDGIGARVIVRAGGLSQVKELYAGASFSSMHSRIMSFGLGATPVTDLVWVRWPSGLIEVFPNVAAGTAVNALVEGTGTPQPAPALSRTVAAAGDRGFTLSVTGAAFSPASQVTFGGTALATTFVSATQLDATVPTALLESAGSRPVVVDPAGPGGPSAAAPFLVTPVALGPCAGTGPVLLRINGQTGNADHRVDLDHFAPVTITVDLLPGTGGAFALFGYLGLPDATHETTLPFVTGTGCFPPCPLLPWDPRLFTLANNAGPLPCTPLVPSAPAPFAVTFGGPGFDFLVALQGVVVSGPGALSFGNALLLKTR